MKVWIRVLAVALAVIGHGFLLAIGTAQNVPLGFAYLGSVMCLWVAAGLLWRRTMDGPPGPSHAPHIERSRNRSHTRSGVW